MNKLIIIANQVPEDNLVGAKTGRNFKLTNYMYGCIDPRSNATLSNVSVTGNSLSIDIWTGCPLQCAYCHVQGVKEDLNPLNWKMRKKPVRRTTHSINEILEELVKHPLFENDKGIISICTSSTEPFMGDEIIESTISIMEWFVKHDLKNPFWIVTKVGVPSCIIDRLKEVSKTNKIIISICWANNSEQIEPYRKDRFVNIDCFLEDKNIFFNWYLRPLVKEWSNNLLELEDMFKTISSQYKNYIHSIVAGGLRWTEGIEYGMTEVRDLSLPDNVSNASRHAKTLTREEFIYIKELGEKYFCNGTSVYLHSSCMLSEILFINNIALTNLFKPQTCMDSNCTPRQRKKCDICLKNVDFKELSSHLNEKKHIDIKIEKVKKKEDAYELVTNPPLHDFAPSISQQIITLTAQFLNKRE